MATPAYGVMYASAGDNNPAYLNHAIGFAAVHAYSTQGGDDSARLYDSAGDDLFTAYPTSGLLTGAPDNPTKYSIQASGFRYLQAFATGGGNDEASLSGSPGDDTLAAYPTYTSLSNTTPGQAFYIRANYFGQVTATATAGGSDIARFYDSPGDDVFTFHAAPGNVANVTDAQMSGSGYLNRAVGFRYVYAYATTGNDEADLYDSAGNDNFYGSGDTARLYDAALADVPGQRPGLPAGQRLRQHGHGHAKHRPADRLRPDVFRHLARRPVAVRDERMMG